ncbi:MAG: glutamine-hydrolyzing carbamoyl-phosphate synthase small subunit [Clostridia bacterium]|nr:glutamine-hydrolyzing carbamoyl-phosphate synthase small subunit [Clostridia bacterium]
MAYLVLENGAVFEGQRIGATGNAVGELVFTTGMVGYLETLTDPAFAGQIVIQTFPLIGNYGVAPQDAEGRPALYGYIVRELCDEPSNFRSEGTLDAFLKHHGIVGLCGVDTRELTRILREHGTMNAVICDNIPEDPAPLKQYCVYGAVAQVSTTKAVIHPTTERRFAVTLIDCGVRSSVIDALCKRGCEVTVVPHDTSAEVILAAKPDGVVLSGGPGDPAENTALIATVKALFGNVPLFGMGLGQQLVALARGGKTSKLKHGHRGANQPVRCDGDRRTYITSQNHGYAVESDTLPTTAVITHYNANDGTCEGIAYTDAPCFTVQFDPDPRDYDRFVALMGGEPNA